MYKDKPSTSATLSQFVISFVIPIIILTKFSGEAQLGPTKGLLLALAFPIGYEAFNIYRRRKLSYVSLLAVGGILVTGAISLLGLSEGWLALRRAVPYFAVGIALLVSILIKHSLIGAILPYFLDMDKVMVRAKKKHQEPAVGQAIKLAGYLVCVLFFLIAIASYVLTRIVIESATNSAGFNEEYAQLRLLSLPIITLPLLIGTTLILFFLVSKIEKLTGLDFEDILKKR